MRFNIQWMALARAWLASAALSQLDDGDRFAASLFGLKGLPRHQRMRLEEFGQSSAQRAGSVAVNNAHTRLAGQRSLVQKFVDALGSFFDRRADQIDFVGGALLRRLAHGDPGGRNTGR